MPYVSKLEKLRIALLDTFRNPPEMIMVVDDANIRVDGVKVRLAEFLAAANARYSVALFDLVSFLDSRGQLGPFLESARRKGGNNPHLRHALEDFQDAYTPFRELPTD